MAIKVVSKPSPSSAPVVASLLKANEIIAECRKTADFKLTYDELDWKSAILVGVSDAALGNVDENGGTGTDVQDRVYSQPVT